MPQQHNEMSEKEILELIDFSMALDFKQKLFWRSKLKGLKPSQRKKLIDLLLKEKSLVKKSLVQKMRGVRGYFFAKIMNDLEQEFFTVLNNS